MRSLIHKAVTATLALALSVSVWTWFQARSDLAIVRGSNESLRQSLGQMSIVLGKKDRELDRLAQAPCDAPRTRTGARAHEFSLTPAVDQ